MCVYVCISYPLSDACFSTHTQPFLWVIAWQSKPETENTESRKKAKWGVKGNFRRLSFIKKRPAVQWAGVPICKSCSNGVPSLTALSPSALKNFLRAFSVKSGAQLNWNIIKIATVPCVTVITDDLSAQCYGKPWKMCGINQPGTLHPSSLILQPFQSTMLKY